MSIRRRYIQELWLSYRQAVIPPQASANQLQECKRAFYAGGQALFNGIILKNLTPGPEEREPDIKLLEDLQAELEDFNKQVKGGLA